MMTWQARSASTPDLNVISRPLFPLPLVLFPGAILPLQIFEFRYRMMMHSLLQTDLRFGVIYSDAVSDSTRALSVEIYGGGGCEQNQSVPVVMPSSKHVCVSQEFRVFVIILTQDRLSWQIDEAWTTLSN
ncbi:hypothetical protein ACLB2K_016700 [Fragaria x ananassa]